MDNNKKKILVVEDDKFISRAFKIGLENFGFSVCQAFNGQEAIDKIFSEKPDVITLDLMMPIKNGFEVLAEIKAEEETKNIPIIVLSNIEDEKEIVRAKGFGIEKYLLKSDCTIDDLILIIQNMFKKN